MMVRGGGSGLLVVLIKHKHLGLESVRPRATSWPKPPRGVVGMGDFVSALGVSSSSSSSSKINE